MTDMREAWLTIAAEDSKRFNRRIARGRIEQIMPQSGALQTEIADMQADIVIIRLPAGLVAPIHELIGSGFVPIHADTLVYHARQLDKPIVDKCPDSTLTAGLANLTDRARIVEIARAAFRSYRSHYHANPLLDSDAITEGYAEWAASFLNSQSPDHETWVVRTDSEVIGFATCAISGKDKSAEIILNAIDPTHAGRGVYGYLLSQMLLSYKTRGLTSVRISTQVWNYAVQRAWARAGFVITHAYDTYHINAIAGQD